MAPLLTRVVDDAGDLAAELAASHDPVHQPALEQELADVAADKTAAAKSGTACSTSPLLDMRLNPRRTDDAARDRPSTMARRTGEGSKAPALHALPVEAAS